MTEDGGGSAGSADDELALRLEEFARLLGRREALLLRVMLTNTGGDPFGPAEATAFARRVGDFAGALEPQAQEIFVARLCGAFREGPGHAVEGEPKWRGGLFWETASETTVRETLALVEEAVLRVLAGMLVPSPRSLVPPPGPVASLGCPHDVAHPGTDRPEHGRGDGRDGLSVQSSRCD